MQMLQDANPRIAGKWLAGNTTDPFDQGSQCYFGFSDSGLVARPDTTYP